MSTDTGRRLSPQGLRDLLAVVNSSRGLDEILAYLVVQAHEVLGSDGVGLYLRDPIDSELLRVQAAHGVALEVQNLSSPIGWPLIGMAFSKRRTVVVTDFGAALGLPPAETFDEQIEDRGTYLEVVRPGPVTAGSTAAVRELNRRLAATYATVAAVPLVAREEAYGTLVLYYHARDAYGAEQVDLSLAFAQQAALAIENARLRSQAEQRLHEIERRQQVAEALRDLLAVVNSNHDLDEILGEVLAQTNLLLGNDAGAIYLREDDSADILHSRASIGLDRDSLVTEIRVGSPTTGLAVAQGRTLVCNDLTVALTESEACSSPAELEEIRGYARVVRIGARTDPGLEDGVHGRLELGLVDGFHAVLCAPLMTRGAAFGALTLYYAEARTFSAEEIDLARAFAEQAALAIDNARLHIQVKSRMLENERRRRVAEGTRDLLANVNSTRSLDEVLDLVLALASDLLGSDAGSVLLLDNQPGQPTALTVRASRALVADIVPSRLPVGTAITGVAVERGQPVAITDLLEALPVRGERAPIMEERPGYLHMQRIGDPAARLSQAVGLPRAREIARYYRALLAVPLVVRGRIAGAITLYYRHPREFSSEDVGLAVSFADQTALALENARLQAQTLSRSRYLEALYLADDVLYRSLRLDEVLQALVDVATDVMEADMTSVLVWDARHERLIPGATRGFRPEIVGRMSHGPGDGIAARVALSGEPIAVENVPDDPRVAQRITAPEGIQSLLHVPIKINDAVFGVFGINYRQRRVLTADHERMLLALARRAAVAIENARLYAESEQRRQEIEALYRADEALHRSLQLDDVLRALADVAHDVLHADKASVHIWDSEHRRLVVAASHGYTAETLSHLLVSAEEVVVADISSSSALVLSDRSNPTLTSPRSRMMTQHEGVRSGIAAPIAVSGQLFGFFRVAYCEPKVPTADEERLVLVLAQRAGLAIHNARLFEQAPLVATAEERQRLARELHDAVTQTLFSASLIAEVAPRIWERNPEQGRERLEELRRLTRGALAEMRTLLLELRPAALVETPFAQLLRQLAEATASRTNVLVNVHAQDHDWPLPPEVKIALYRIAQESLSNIGKHAIASRAEIHLRRRADRLGLHLSDNGSGFDPGSATPGHLGLGIMRERARDIGARLRIESRPSAGTRIHVHWRGSSV